MRVKKYLDLVAYIGPSKGIGDDVPDSYYSKFDGSYITFVGLEKNVKFLADREITEQLTHGVGFSPKDNMWYGWSHRVIYGFTIGSTCKKGDCHYKASNIEEEIEAAKNFWEDDCHEYTKANVKEEGVIEVTWKYNNKTPNKSIRGSEMSTEWLYNPKKFGKGEWVAETMEDAKQMAIDFNEGVS